MLAPNSLDSSSKGTSLESRRAPGASGKHGRLTGTTGCPGAQRWSCLCGGECNRRSRVAVSTISLSQIHPAPGHRPAPQVQPVRCTAWALTCCSVSSVHDGPPLCTRDPQRPPARRAEPGTPRHRAPLRPRHRRQLTPRSLGSRRPPGPAPTCHGGGHGAAPRSSAVRRPARRLR